MYIYIYKLNDLDIHVCISACLKGNDYVSIYDIIMLHSYTYFYCWSTYPPLTYPPRNKGSVHKALLRENQWLMSPKNQAGVRYLARGPRGG